MSAPMSGADPADQRDRLLGAAAVEGLDLDAARTRADTLARGRRRVLRSSMAAVGVVLAVAAGTWVVLGDDDPDELVADRAERTTTTSTSSTSTSVATTVAPTTLVAPPTLATTTTLAPTTTVATTTTLPPNQALRVELRVLTPRVAAGEVAAVEAAWVDPDHAGTTPDVVADWGDPAVTALNLPLPATRCDTPGTSGGGTERREFRYATPGTHRVQLTLTTCGGEGAYAERVTIEGTVTVTAATVGDAAGRTVVAVAPRTASGLPVLPSLDSASAVLDPADPAEPEVALPAREPVLFQFGTAGPATVLRLPAGAVGTIRLRWADSPCTATVAVDLSGPGDAPPVLALDSVC